MVVVFLTNSSTESGREHYLCNTTGTRGQGTKRMVVADRAGLPLAAHTVAETPPEVPPFPDTLVLRFTPEFPEQLIGDQAFDRDPLDAQWSAVVTEMIAPHPPHAAGHAVRAPFAP